MSDHSQNIKYQHILSAGKALFWKHGVKRVSVEEICSQSNVSKMTFYKFFKNKRELALAILEDTSGAAFIKYKELIAKECSFTAKVNAMLQMKLEGTKDISQEFIMDIYQNPALNLLPYIEELGKKSLAITIEFLLDSQKKGFIRKEIKIDFILYYFNQMLQMTTDTALLSKYDKPQDLIMEATEFFFYGIGAKQQ